MSAFLHLVVHLCACRLCRWLYICDLVFVHLDSSFICICIYECAPEVLCVCVFTLVLLCACMCGRLCLRVCTCVCVSDVWMINPDTSSKTQTEMMQCIHNIYFIVSNRFPSLHPSTFSWLPLQEHPPPFIYHLQHFPPFSIVFLPNRVIVMTKNKTINK